MGPLEFSFLAVSRIAAVSWRFFYFALFGVFFKKFSLTSYVSPFASIKNPRHVKIGRRVIINRNSCLWGNIEIGNDVQVNPNTCIYGKCKIGNFVMIAPNCVLAGGTHGVKFGEGPMIYQPCSDKEIIIEDDVWIGANCVIAQGVRIGSGAVIGAGTTVREDVPPNSVLISSTENRVKFYRSGGV